MALTIKTNKCCYFCNNNLPVGAAIPVFTVTKNKEFTCKSCFTADGIVLAELLKSVGLHISLDANAWLCPGVPVHRGNNHCTLLFMNLCLAVEHCWVFCIGSCEPVHEDRTKCMFESSSSLEKVCKENFQLFDSLSRTRGYVETQNREQFTICKTVTWKSFAKRIYTRSKEGELYSSRTARTRTKATHESSEKILI